MPIRRRGGSGGTALSENIVDALEGAASPAAGNPFATVEDIPADLSSDIKAALTGASSPSAANPFATVADAGGTSVLQTFTATASQTVFDASSIWPTGTYALAVFRNGLYQTLTTDYTVDGTAKTVTFVAACNEGDIVNVIFNAPVAAIPVGLSEAEVVALILAFA